MLEMCVRTAKRKREEGLHRVKTAGEKGSGRDRWPYLLLYWPDLIFSFLTSFWIMFVFCHLVQALVQHNILRDSALWINARQRDHIQATHDPPPGPRSHSR